MTKVDVREFDFVEDSAVSAAGLSAGRHWRVDAMATADPPGEATKAAKHLALDLVADAVYFVSLPDLRVVDTNAAAGAWHVRYTGTLAGRHLGELFRTTGDLRAMLDPLFRGHLPEMLIAATRRDDSGRLRACTIRCQVIEFDGLTSLVVVARPARAKREASRSELAAHGIDDLTGLATRRTFAVRLQRAISRGPTPGRKAVLLFVDLDDFKAVNDTHGHFIGDTVLRTVGRRLSRCLRPRDLAARYGGDELVVLLRGVADEGQLATIVARIDEAIRTPIRVGERQLTVSASIGVAVHDGLSTSREILHAADQAMFRAKAGKRQTA